VKPPGSKLGIDATKKLPGDSVNQPHRRQRPNLALRDSIQQMVRAGVVVVAAAAQFRPTIPIQQLSIPFQTVARLMLQRQV